MATLNALRTLVQREVMTCPSFIVDTALNMGARKFLDIARYWRESVDVVTAAGVGEIAVDSPSGTSPIEIITVKHADTLKYLNDAQVPRIRSTRSDNQDRPQFFGTVDAKIIEVSPYPDAVYHLIVEMAVKPALSGMTVPDRVIDQCGEGIATLAVADLLGQTGHPWTDINKAELRRQQGEGMAWEVWHRSAAGGYTKTSQTLSTPFSWV